MDVKKILSETISNYDSYCDGFIGSHYNATSANPNYITGILLDIGVVKIKYSHQGSMLLDKILAFDKAEVAGTNLGQINMITVSSFCGPSGLIWGYDIAKHPEVEEKLPVKYVYGGDRKIPIYSAEPLKKAMAKLFGTVVEKRFPLLPGAHVPCAGKNITIDGPNHIYAALAFGIARDREKNACLFMEDVGTINNFIESGKKMVKEEIINNIISSVLEVGRNQKVEYEKIFVDMVDCDIKKDEIGCALVAAPYFKLAKKAIADGDMEKTASVSLEVWEKSCRPFFIDKKL